MSTSISVQSNTPQGLIVSGHTWAAMKEQCAMLVRSGFLPESIKTPEQALAIAMKGHEIGMALMQAFSQIHVIKGKPTISAEGMNFLIRKNCPQAKLEILVSDGHRCQIKATRPGEQPFTATYTIEDAKRAGITGNPSWSKYPEAMLFARCMSGLARRVFPDCLNGISYTPEELGAEVGELGEIINISPSPQKEESESKQTPTKPPYDPNNTAQRDYLVSKAAEAGLTSNEDLKALSSMMVGKNGDYLPTAIEIIKTEKFFDASEVTVEPL